MPTDDLFMVGKVVKSFLVSSDNAGFNNEAGSLLRVLGSCRYRMKWCRVSVKYFIDSIRLLRNISLPRVCLLGDFCIEQYSLG